MEEDLVWLTSTNGSLGSAKISFEVEKIDDSSCSIAVLYQGSLYKATVGVSALEVVQCETVSFRPMRTNDKLCCSSRGHPKLAEVILQKSAGESTTSGAPSPHRSPLLAIAELRVELLTRLAQVEGMLLGAPEQIPQPSVASTTSSPCPYPSPSPIPPAQALSVMPPQEISTIVLDDLKLHLSCLSGTVNGSRWVDISGWGNNVTVSGNAHISETHGYFCPDGCGRATAPCDDSFQNLTTFTLEAWIKPAAFLPTAGNGGFVLVNVGAYYLEVKQDGKVSVYLYGVSPAGYHDSTATVALNKKSHIAFTYSENSMKIFIDGALDREIRVSGTPSYKRYHLALGGYDSNTYKFPGFIYVARIYGKELSASELKANYEAEKEAIDRLI
jgi:hypothetical protein